MTFNGSSWSSPTSIDSNGLSSVSCPNASFCVAVDASGRALSFNGSSWSSPLSIDSNGLSSVSCSTASFCVAVDGTNALTFNGSSWSAPAAAGSGVSVVSCPNPSFCAAIGYGSLVTFNGSSWSSATVIDSGSIVSSSVSCVSSSFCVAVDDYGYPIEYGHAMTFNGSSWSPPTGIGIDGLYSVSCPTTSFCVAVDAGGNAYTYSVPPVPMNTQAPSISGTARQGQALTESHGSWTNSPTSYTYQWEDCDALGNNCSASAGATSQTYTLTAADVGHTIRVQETARNAGGSSTPASSAPTGLVQAVSAPATKPSSSSPAAITGTARAGQTLSASTGAWSGTPPISYAYQWQLCKPGCSNISGATASSLTLTPADIGARVRVIVTATNSAGSSQATSSQVGPVATAAPTTGQVTAALVKALTASGLAAKIAQLLKHGGYPISFTAPSAGRLVISWYLVPRGAHLANAKKPVLIATASITLPHAGKANLKLALTRNGRQILKNAKRLSLTAKGSFTPAGGAVISTTRNITLKR